MNTNTAQLVIVGMSGGVDSSVAAQLLQAQGYTVKGVFMKNWEEREQDTECPAAIDANDAWGVCQKLGIDFDAVNFAQEYWDRVFAFFLEEYQQGRTPNPDILCNKEIKFKAFLDYALAQGAAKIATGHYARIKEYDGQYHLLKGKDDNKDQSYFLYTLGQKALSKSLFPLGEIEKPEVRRIAMAAGFENHAKKDSTGICFIGERKFKQFLNQYIPAQPGDIRTPDNTKIGTHDGLMFYTIGQRKGLGIGGVKDASEDPWYVIEKNLDSNTLIVAQGEHPKLYSLQLTASDVHWVSGSSPVLPLRAMAKTRYRQPDQACLITQVDDDQYEIIFDQPQRAVTTGQSVVFYDQDECLGGGIIDAVQIADTTTAKLASA